MLNDREKQMRYYDRAISIYDRTLMHDHPDFADTCYNVAKTYVDMEQYAEALEWARRAVDIAQRALPTDHVYRIVYQEFLTDLERVKQ